MVFDDETAEVVVSRWRRGAAEILHEHPVDAALKAGKQSVVVMPSRIPGQMLVARFQVRTALPENTPLPEIAETTAVDVTPAAAERKPWWRKFVA
jgi:hypothetical protein